LNILRINQCRLPVSVQGEQLQNALLKKAAKLLGCRQGEIDRVEILRRSLDARHKPELFYSYTVDVTLKEPFSLKKLKGSSNVQPVTERPYRFPRPGTRKLSHRPVIVGTGPCGLFAGYLLALHGYCPILLERGAPVEERARDVEAFWESGVLKPDSNVLFGEGGAGTFSDGKLNTLVKDKDGRNREVLRFFVEMGAPEQILYDAKPHIGTDILRDVVRNIRQEILAHGGEIRFHSKVTGLCIGTGTRKLCGVVVNGQELIETEICVLAIGHSARDTYQTLHNIGIPMEAKSFAVGFRVEHPQELIDNAQYGRSRWSREDADGLPKKEELPAAAYKLTAKTSSGRGVYSFCMCPGGFVVNASSEQGLLAVNGMSYSGRDGANANSAIIVSVSPGDYPTTDALAGIAFQRALERKAYELGGGAVPIETYGEFKRAVAGGDGSGDKCRASGRWYADFKAAHKGEIHHAPVHEILTTEMNQAFVEGMEHFDKIIPGFADERVMVSGIESRTSSPVRICRDETMQSEIRGLYPCGEGAGFAGGIMSAAMDGMRAAEMIGSVYAPVADI